MEPEAVFLGIPGDVTPPSRFVRAAFYQATAPVPATSQETVLQGFQILNNFDIPIGIEFAKGQTPVDIPSATQWTSATDMTSRTNLLPDDVQQSDPQHRFAENRFLKNRISGCSAGYGETTAGESCDRMSSFPVKTRTAEITDAGVVCS